MSILWSIPGTEQQTPEFVEEKRDSFNFDLICFIFMILLPCNGEKKDNKSYDSVLCIRLPQCTIMHSKACWEFITPAV